MKKIILSICLMIVSIIAFGQWTLLNPTPTNYNLTSVYFSDVNTGYAVGDSGTILRTTDGGINWSGLPTGTPNQLNVVYFADANTGYAVGGYLAYLNYDCGGTILKTTDVGATWDTLTSEELPYLCSVFFTDANTGYTGGYRLIQGPYYGLAYPSLVKTIDGGANWTESSIGISQCISSIYFTNTNTGYAVGWEGGEAQPKSWVRIFKTINAGLNWDYITISTANTSHDTRLNHIYFPTADTGYASGLKSIFKTTDAGVNWTQILSLSKTDGELSSIYFYDASIGYAIGEIGSILKTIDGGITWTAQSSATTNGLTSVYFTDSNIGYIVGVGGTILKTTNGGGPLHIDETVSSASIFALYPNPATNKITISNEKENPGETMVSIISISGQLVMQARFKNQKQFDMDVSNLAKGIYLVKIQTKTGIETKKLVIQ